MSTNAITSTPQADPARAHAPGKIILSGEHAVVYGAPALAVAVARYTEVTFKPILSSTGLRTAFDNLSSGQFYPLELLRNFKHGLDERFDRFLKGDLPVQKILQRPDDLVIYTMASLVHHLPMPGVRVDGRLPVPGQLNSRSDLPVGAGMGSSAAVIAATFILYEGLMEHAQTLEERFERVRFCERLQHGKGGAIDAASVVFGGANRVQDGALTRLDPLPGLSGDAWYWVLHGAPDSSTGECVAAVRNRFGDDRALWADFAAVTDAVQQALTDSTDPAQALRRNHRLLCHIGVVPPAAQRFVAALEARGASAKICGAGAVRGDHGGIVLVHCPDPAAMADHMAHYPEMRWDRLKIAPQGAARGPAPGTTPGSGPGSGPGPTSGSGPGSDPGSDPGHSPAPGTSSGHTPTDTA